MFVIDVSPHNGNGVIVPAIPTSMGRYCAGKVISIRLGTSIAKATRRLAPNADKSAPAPGYFP